MGRLSLFTTSALIALASTSLITGAAAQDGKHHLRHSVTNHAVATANGPVVYRGLTINRPPEAPFADDDGDIYQDGPVRYNDIRDFSPSPYTTSGVQYPFGLDGIGGYGSDLDFGAGQDTALYGRGPGNRP